MINDQEFNKSIESYITRWDQYLEYADNLLDTVLPSRNMLEGYVRIASAYFTEGVNTFSKIIAVYEDLYVREDGSGLILFRNYVTIQQKNETSVPDSNISFSKRLGHNNNKCPLTDAQRTAVSPLLDAKNREILAVNSPPRTGKTTMFLSVVTCLWVKNAVEKNEPLYQ